MAKPTAQTPSRLVVDEDYLLWIRELSQRYRQHQIKAALHVQDEMLRFYWSVGEDIVSRQMENRYGSHFYDTLSRDLQHSLGVGRGLSATSLKYSKYFYSLYSQYFANRQQLADKSSAANRQQLADESADEQFSMLFRIPWSHHQKIIDKVGCDTSKALFFVRKTIQNQWGRAMLVNMLSTDLYETRGQSVNNFPLTMPKDDSDLARDLFKGSYQFGFTRISQPYNEADLKARLVSHIQQFLIELGRGFSFVGREYRISGGGHEKFIDLLFYVIPLHRYCVIEVKVTEFDFPDVGQLLGYMGMVDAILNCPGDNPCVGLLICQSKDNIFAQYSLGKINAPIGIADYDIRQLLPEKEIEAALAAPANPDE